MCGSDIIVNMSGRGRQKHILDLLVLAQAVEDVLRFELGLPLEGVAKKKRDESYEDALIYIMKFPKLRERYKKLNKKRWLREVQDARE